MEEESDATVIETAGRLDLSLLPTAAGDLFGINTSANCFIFGDFDIRVDFSLTSWPVANGVRTSLTVNSRDTRLGIERSAWGPDTGWTDTEYYIMNGNSMRKGYTPTSDLDGKLRLQRIGDEITGYVFQENTGWEMLASYTMEELDMDPAEPVFFSLNAWSHDEFFNPGGQTVTVSFDNMDVTGENLFYPNKRYRQFAYAVDFFAIQGNVQGGAVLDEFNDGILWENVSGNVMELDGFLLLQDPGQMEMFFADNHVVFEQYSGISTSVDTFAIENGRGDFAARTKWHVPFIDSDTLILFNLLFRDMPGPGAQSREITAGIYDFGPFLSAVLEV
ncbi:MAG: hypothetical protein V2J08_11140, partial [Desulfotignum sp.]|nr:hypothetical protein [Desulfotignum sp.]